MPKVAVVMPAYNAEATLATTYENLPKIYDYVYVCDDASGDNTAAIAKKLGLKRILHSTNRGYGANQKSLYKHALKNNVGIVVMVHPDNQYNTDNLPAMIKQINQGVDLVLGTRMKAARHNGMPLWKFASNRFLTIAQNKVYNKNLSEYHTGLRVYSARLLAAMPYVKFSNDFVFDSEVIAWTIANNFKISEIDADCYYNSSASSIKLWPSLVYGFNTLSVLWRFKTGYYKK